MTNKTTNSQGIPRICGANPRSSAVGGALRSGRRGRVFESPLLDKRDIHFGYPFLSKGASHTPPAGPNVAVRDAEHLPDETGRAASAKRGLSPSDSERSTPSNTHYEELVRA